MDGTQHEVREKEMSASIRMLEVAPIEDKGKRNCLRWFQSCIMKTFEHPIMEEGFDVSWRHQKRQKLARIYMGCGWEMTRMPRMKQRILLTELRWQKGIQAANPKWYGSRIHLILWNFWINFIVSQKPRRKSEVSCPPVSGCSKYYLTLPLSF